MDALPGIGHACGHNLIAISGIMLSFRASFFLSALHFIQASVYRSPLRKLSKNLAFLAQWSCSERLVKDHCDSLRPRSEILPSIAEEVGSGKVELLDEGAYQNMDACLMFVSFLLLSSFSFSWCWNLKVSPCSWTGRFCKSQWQPGSGKDRS